MEIIIEYLINYFSDLYHVIFWFLILMFSIYELIKNKLKRSNKLKLWLKKHNIGKKYWF